MHRGPVPLGDSPEAYVRGWVRDLERPVAQTEEERTISAHDLAASGAKLTRDLLPPEIAAALGTAVGRAATLQIVSDETAIPWELLRLRFRGEDGSEKSGFLGELFAVVRWIAGANEALALPLSRIALIAVDADLPAAVAERALLRNLAEASGRQAIEVEGTKGALVKGLSQAKFDAWHYAGHGDHNADPDRSGLRLNAQDRFTPDHLELVAGGIRQARPFFFWNACTAGRGGLALTGLGGWAARLLEKGASAFVAPFWKVTDSVASLFAATFYGQLFAGAPIAEAAARARCAARDASPGDASWLAYAVFAHPAAMAVSVGSAVPRAAVPLPFESSPPRPVGSVYLSTAPRPPELFVGRAADLARVKEMLGVGRRPSGSAPLATIRAVRGLGGIGKSSLAAVLAADSEVQTRYPDGLLWLPLGSRPDLLGRIAELGLELGDDALLASATPREAFARLRKWLAPRRVLLVLDDIVAAAHVEPFRQVCPPEGGLLLTTREPAIVHRLAIGPEADHPLAELDDHYGLEILRALSPGAVEGDEEAARDLVRSLGGLPLALCVAGGLLRREQESGLDAGDLLRAIRDPARLLDEAAPANRIDPELLAVPTVRELFARCTDRLAPDLRACFAKLGEVASKPASFGLDLLRGLWGVEDARPIVRELVGRGLLEPGRAGFFQIHPLLAAHARSIGSRPEP
ncbi:MAG TPA: NB-ARC domain-containing protein [Thermoanaerobaculia bacterium]|jgi:hypothetical protein|nr:NB-ARC domain-containing protein [Thermoanaerobaculia bacterium]